MIRLPAVRLAAVVVALVTGATAHARAAVLLGPGGIVATVRDLDGKPVVGALVVADGPTEREAVTGPAGIVTLLALPLGSYSVRVTRSGFEPLGMQVMVRDGREGAKALDLRLAPATFANLHGAADVSTVPLQSGSADPSVTRALDASPFVDVLPGRAGPGSSRVSILGTDANETRVELDGVPLAGAATGRDSLRFRNALVLDDAELAKGPVAVGDSARDAVGGVLNFRTAPISQQSLASVSVGYNSGFGSFQEWRAADSTDRFGLALDAVTGGGENRSQVFKTQYALSRSTSLSLASYGSQSTATLDGANVTSVAPVFAADLRTRLGDASLQFRSYESAARTVSDGPAGEASLEDARIHGLAVEYDLPLGEHLVTLAYDRRHDFTQFEGLQLPDQIETSFAMRGDFQLTRLSRLQVGEVISGGTFVPRRADPQIGLSVRAGERLTLRLAAGSAFATAPDSVLLRPAPLVQSFVPETSFGVRLSAEGQLDADDRLTLDAYQLRRFDRFSNLADARSVGIALGFRRDPRPGALGVSGFVDLARTYGYGPPQPPYRYSPFDAVAGGAQLPGVPYAKGRLEFAYRVPGRGLDLRLGTTYYGANNALAGSATALSDASLRVGFGRTGALSFGVQNLTGRVLPSVSQSALAPLVAPRTVTLSISTGARSSGGP